MHVAAPTVSSGRSTAFQAQTARWASASGLLLLALLRRLAALVVLLLLLTLLPWGPSLGPIRVKHAVLTFLAVLGIGKILLDTFYWDRYRT